MVGILFTRSNSSSGFERIECRLDRALSNMHLYQIEGTIHGSLLNHNLSDHTPILISLTGRTPFKPPFRYFNTWAREEEFFKIVNDAWDISIDGSPLFRVVKKLFDIKCALRLWRNNKPQVDMRIQSARDKLELIQSLIRNGYYNDDGLQTEKNARKRLHDLLLVKESMLKQKSRDQSLNRGDSNTRYFHSIFQENQKKCFIHEIKDSRDVVHKAHMTTTMVDHFQNLFCPL